MSGEKCESKPAHTRASVRNTLLGEIDNTGDIHSILRHTEGNRSYRIDIEHPCVVYTMLMLDVSLTKFNNDTNILPIGEFVDIIKDLINHGYPRHCATFSPLKFLYMF